jgi:hypothetical protein
MMFETLIVDDIVDIHVQRYLHENIMDTAQWKFLKDVSGVENQTYPSHGFVHLMKHPSMKDGAGLYPLMKKLMSAMQDTIGMPVNDETNYHNRIFLQLPLAGQYKKEHNGVHVDLPKELPHIACVYYVNGSDGETIIYDQCIGDDTSTLTEHARVKPKRGRMVFFDGARYHCSSQPTINYRCIINFDILKGV